VTGPGYGDTTTNEATGFSGFGGHLLIAADRPDVLLAGAAAEGGEAVSQIASLGVTDAEQLLALSSIPGVREELEASIPGVQALIDQAAQILPADRLQLVTAPAARDLGLGVLPLTDEMQSAMEAAAAAPMPMAAAVLPPAVNLVSYMSAIRNQGSRGTCVSFTLTALNEYILRRRGYLRDQSEQHLYYEIKLIDGAPNECGTWQTRAVNALRNRGQCREVVWPYNPSSACNAHGALPAQARPDGLTYRLTTIQVSARNVAAYRSHMALQRPVTLSIPVYDSWYRSAETRRSGRITMRVGSEAAVGGHAVCLVGYQDSASSPGGGYFIVRNHWGTGWAYASPYGPGYGIIPYQYIANEASEAFTAAVPGIQTEQDEAEDEDVQDDDGQATDGKSTVTISVGKNVKITITTS
jgi:C1A family cysteine protease